MNFVNKTAFKRKMLQLNYESKLARLDNNSHVVHSLQVAKEDTKKHHQKPVRFLFFLFLFTFSLMIAFLKNQKSLPISFANFSLKFCNIWIVQK